MGAMGGSPLPELGGPLFHVARVVGPQGSASIPMSDAVDIDGDGWLDLALRMRSKGATSWDTVGVAINDHHGGYRDVIETPLDRLLSSAVFVDLNGDGRSELVVATASPVPTLSVAKGQGDGSFAEPQELVVGEPPLLARLVAAGDLNGDGLADIVVFDRTAANTGSSGALYFLLNTGQGTLAEPKRLVLSWSERSVLFAVTVRDLDGDGMGEILIEGGSASVLVPNLGGGAMGSPRTYLISHPVAAADVDGDGRLDLIGQGPTGLTILVGGTTDFVEAGPFQICRRGGGLAVADVTGDARPDIACTDQRRVRIHPNLGNLAFGERVELAGVGNVSSVADWDHDGDQDIIADGGTVVFFNEGGSLPKLQGGSARPQAQSVAVGDVNADGILDIVTADTSGTRAYLGRADGTYVSVSESAEVAATNAPGLGDLDGDGRLDLVVSYTEPGGRIGVARNDGTGRFAQPAFFATGPYPRSSVVADLNGDGKPDILAAIAGGVSVLINDGQGHFPSHLDHDVGDRPALITGDLDGDGASDIVAAGADGVSLLRNRGDGTFSAAAALHPGGGTVTLIDLNGDGRPEIALGGSGGDLVIHRNNGDGTFGGVAAVIGRRPELRDDPLLSVSVSAGDVNGDGRADLVAFYGWATSAAAVRTYLSDGTGTLWRGEVYALAPSPADRAFGDLNSDGRPDIILPAR